VFVAPSLSIPQYALVIARLPPMIRSMFSGFVLALSAAATTGCDEKAANAPALPPALQKPTATAALSADPVDLIEGPLEALGVRLPLGTRRLSGSAADVFDVQAPVEHVERYFRARLTSDKVSRELGGIWTFDRARPRATLPSSTGLPLRVVLRPVIAGTRISLSEEATGLPVSSAEPSVPEAEILLELKRGREQRDLGALGPTAPTDGPGVPAQQLAPGESPPSAPAQPDDDDDDDE
jgi:hypothetical protein